MRNMKDKSRNKEVVTVRLDAEAKSALTEICRQKNRTMSSMIDLAVSEFLNKNYRSVKSKERGKIVVKHAKLIDTSIIRAFCELSGEKYREAISHLDLPEISFADSPDSSPEWSRIAPALNEDKTDLIESFNWAPIFMSVKRGEAAPKLDWIGPFLQIFGCHCIFISKKYVEQNCPKLSSDYQEFRDGFSSDRELSQCSMISYIQSNDENMNNYTEIIARIWQSSIITCQRETDYHIAVRRVAPLLNQISCYELDCKDPVIRGCQSLELALSEYKSGVSNLFIGNILQSAELFTYDFEDSFLFAGPQDVRVASLNTIAGKNDLIGPNSTENHISSRLLQFWGMAVEWYKSEVISSDSSNKLIREILKTHFQPFLEKIEEKSSDNVGMKSDDFYHMLKTLMRSWVLWLDSPDAAKALYGIEYGNNKKVPSAQTLVEQYERLCNALYEDKMPEPENDGARQNSLWPFQSLYI